MPKFRRPWKSRRRSKPITPPYRIAIAEDINITPTEIYTHLYQIPHNKQHQYTWQMNRNQWLHITTHHPHTTTYDPQPTCNCQHKPYPHPHRRLLNIPVIINDTTDRIQLTNKPNRKQTKQ